MNPEELLDNFRKTGVLPISELSESAAYRHNGKEDWNESNDLNEEFREILSGLLLESFNEKDLELIRFLLKEEMQYAWKESVMRETLRQLSFMLYCLGTAADTALLIEAKLGSGFDASLGLDAELVLGKHKEEAKAYFKKHPHERFDIPKLISEYEEYHLRSPEQFMNDLREYYRL